MQFFSLWYSWKGIYMIRDRHSRCIRRLTMTTHLRTATGLSTCESMTRINPPSQCLRGWMQIYSSTAFIIRSGVHGVWVGVGGLRRQWPKSRRCRSAWCAEMYCMWVAVPAAAESSSLCWPSHFGGPWTVIPIEKADLPVVGVAFLLVLIAC